MEFEQNCRVAYSSHLFCFICKRSNKRVRLHKVKLPSIRIAFNKFKILIKHHARCCNTHLDINGLIKMDEFNNIPTKTKYLHPKTKDLFIAIFRDVDTFFEKFRDIDLIDDEFCLDTTGWTKNKFIEFSSYITSINNTSSRTKEQLVALYRYWLRKGIDQNSLSKLFGNQTTQKQISNYLDQIRRAIYKDFVPFFLGSNKRRSFFLKHNNIMTTQLHDLSSQCISIFVDATYCRLEKSANNQFQYDCWSGQKMDLLIKPFIVCCADGYIIDCYGPFKAHQNDATILKYILKEDKDLLKLVTDGETAVFMDRGI